MSRAPGFSVSLVEYGAVWRHLGLGGQPYPLVASTGQPTGADRLRVQQGIRRGLTGRGLLRAGVLDPELEELFHLLASNTAALYARTGMTRAIAATDGYSGVLAVSTDTDITLRPIRPSDLSGAVREVLPTAVPGRTGIAADRYEQLSVLVAGSLRSGVFGASPALAGPETGELVWFDLPEGRYLATRNGDALVVVPASGELIGNHLAELVTPAMIGGVRCDFDVPTPPVGLALR